MAETKIVRQTVEALGDPGVRLGVDRQDAEVVASFTQPVQTNVYRQTIEVLSAESTAASLAVDRQDAEAVASFTATEQTNVYRQTIEVLGGAAVSFSVDRQDAEAVASFTNPTEAALFRMVSEVAAREQATGSVVPRPLNTTDLFVHNWVNAFALTSSFSTSVSYSPSNRSGQRISQSSKSGRVMPMARF